MARTDQLLQGEFRRLMDDRYRLSIPSSLADPLTTAGPECIAVKERPGAISLWSAGSWETRLDAGLQVVREKIQAGRLEGKIDQVQQLGRLLSTRQRSVQLAGRGRLLIPEGFREFLGVEPGGEVIVIGAAVCVELWQPTSWLDCLQVQIPQFRELFDDLSG
ncbi:MAG: division/cell wall cluster transcriptional repressor MraZ [Pirellulaceae bacterium]|nr:division/cell wall cluster transcriptional repressor MraZ [Planctomycetaceae bacterium]